MARVDSSDWSWAARMEDFDNDGRVDIFVTNGHTRAFNDSDLLENMVGVADKTIFDMLIDEPVFKETNKAYRNMGDMAFQSNEAAWGLDLTGMSYAAATGDLDNDGDLDLIVANLDEPIGVYRNDISNSNSVIVQLEGSQSNRQGIGATIEATVGSRKQISMINPHRGFQSSNEPIAHFGLGNVNKIDSLKILWPSGKVQILNDVQANQRLLIREPAKADKPQTASTETMFTQLERTSLPTHKEIDFDDFELQPLLPNKLSQLGPGVSIGDVNGDGLEDVYVSRGRVQRRSLVLGSEQQKWLELSIGRPGDDSNHEDMASLFFDVEGDGDQDLFVVSGGVENDNLPSLLNDRLYLNDGKGNLTRAGTDVLTEDETSGSVVAAADFDRDGDLDLFVGGRVKPGQYPLSPRSRLLQNESKDQQPKLTDVTSELAADLEFCGMVTSAVWSDVNNDQWIDLLVTTEWGPIHVFLNQEGKLVRNQQSGLENHLGWWNGIASRDIDNDGDIDFVATILA